MRWGVRAAGLGLAALLVVIGFFGATARAAPVVLFSEDFESDVWNPALVVYDEDFAAGEDYWGRTDVFFHGGGWSAAAAAVGTYSADGYPNIGTGPSAIPVVRYDHNMSASMDLNVSATMLLEDRVLEFHFAAQTEPWLVDYLSVLGLAQGAWQTLWSQNVTVTADFYRVDVPIPSGIEWVSFHFYSDQDNEGNMTYLGVFVDDIVLTGTPPEPTPDVIPPGSRALVALNRTTSLTFDVEFEASDDDSGLRSVELWVSYIADGTAHRRKYGFRDVSGLSAQGAFAFDAAAYVGVGTYSFYTIAVDVAGNREEAPASPDAVVEVVAASGPDLGSLALWAGMGAGGTAVLVLRARRRRREGMP